MNLLIPVLFRAFESGLGIENTSVVEKNIEETAVAESLVHGALAFGGYADIGRNKHSLAVGLTDLLSHGGTAFLIPAGDGNFRTFFGEKQRRGFTDPRSATRDECNFVF